MQTVKTTVGYRYDEAGYLISDAIVQENQARPGQWMMPDRVTLEKPDESKLKTHFVRRVDGQWTYEAIPTSAAWFIGKQISHKSQTLHDRTLRALLQKLVKEDSEHYRIIRGTPEEGLYWSVEAIPEKSANEKALDEKNAQIAQLKSQLQQTDYVAAKLAEGVATKDEYAEVLANRAAWRTQINELEAEVQTLTLAVQAEAGE